MIILIVKNIFHQRKTSADKSRNIVKGRKISQAEHDGKTINIIFLSNKS
jgi:hypothetical protein